MRTITIGILFLFASCELQSQERIKVYEDGNLTGEYYFNDIGLLKKEVAFNIATKESDTLLYVFQQGELKSIQLKGDDNITAFDEQRELMYYQNTQLQIELLSRYNIIIGKSDKIDPFVPV